SYEAIIRNKEGKPIPISFSTAFLKDEESNIIGGVEIFRDLSIVKNLIEQLQGKYSFSNIIGKNHKMQKIYDLIQQVAHTDTVVLITGESGTGKELIARAIHYNSSRKDKPFIKVDCASLVESLLESELFGHVKGAFTGAISDKAGRFELADGGTIFLDEIGNIGLTSQAKLLRVLQNGEFERVGESKTNKVDVRVIAATNIDIKKAVREKKFREDLYYRLKVVSIHLPPLRERKEDIPLIVRHFVDRFNKSMGKEVINIFPGAMEMLMRYNYPGNIRELENIIEHAFIRCNGNTIFPHHLPEDFLHDEKGFIEGILKSKRPFEDLERRLILKVLDETNWAYQEAASRLGISRATLWRKIKRHGIKKEDVADM
ncbi:MAG: sigma 54-interacting transcriptional regulator, partial [Nitrospirae bacterium]|nr:sigma 54-interacting transcriptional regulator [Nitrospirota bacterium]